MTKIYNFLLYIYTYIDVAAYHIWDAVDDKRKAWANR